MSNECEGGLHSRNPYRSEGRSTEKAESGKNLVLAIWALALFTAFLFGSTIVNVILTKQAYEGTKSQIEAIRALNDSMLEVRKSLAEFSGAFQEAQEMDHGADDTSLFQKPYLGDEKV